MKIRMKINILLLATIAICIGGTAFMAERYIQFYLRSTIERYHLDYAITSASRINMLINEKILESELLSQQPNVLNAARIANKKRQGMKEETFFSEIKDRDRQWISEKDHNIFANQILGNSLSIFLKKYIQRYPGRYAEIIITDKQGCNIGITNITSDYYQADEQWWEYAFANGKGDLFIDDCGLGDISNNYSLGIVVPIRNNGEVIGIVKIYYKMNGFLEEVFPRNNIISDAEEGNAFVYRSSGEGISNNAAYTPDFGMINNIITGENGIAEGRNRENKTIVGYARVKSKFFQRIPNPGEIKGVIGGKWVPITWYFVNENDQKTAYTAVHRMRLWVFVLVLIFSGIGFFVAVSVSNSISYPINALRKDIQLFWEKGLISATWRWSKDEIGDLHQLFHKMSEGLNGKTALQEQTNKQLMLANKSLELATDELRLAKSVAENASKAKSEFLSSMSHEVRTPLNAIIGLTRLALDTELNFKQTDYLRKVFSSSMSLLNIVNDILDFSKIEAHKVAIENINIILAETVENTMDTFVEKANEKGLKMTCQVDSDVPAVVTGDPYRLGQVLNNIIGNAVKFTGKGEIHLKVEAAERTEESCMLRFTVTDTGIGLSGEQIKDIFTPFQQADGTISRRFGGTGLGLAISKRLVTLMGGDISASGELGKGSSFAFTVRFGVSKSQDLASDFAGLRAMKALVVDDSPSSLNVLGRFLGSWKFDVTLSASGEECLRQLELADKAEKPFQLLLLDWNMPNMTGLEVAKKIHENVAQGRLTVLPTIIMVTGYSQEHLQAEAVGIKLDAMLTKPLRASRLYNTILRLQQPGIRQFTLCPLLQDNLLHSTKKLQGARLLLVEDNEINQQVAFEMLSKIGIHVVIANNGYEAVTMAENEAFDGILMDLQMPGMDGYQTTALIKRMPGCKDIPIIAMSAAVMEEDKRKCLSVGMVDHVAKPIMPETLIGALLKWVKPAREGIAAAQPVVFPEPEGYNVPLNLPGFNFGGAIQRLGGNKKLLCGLLHKFCDDYASVAGKLDTLTQACDVNGTLAILHSLRGVSGSLGISIVYDHVVQLENRIRGGQFPVSFETLDHVLQEAFMTISQSIKKPASPINPRAEYVQEDAAKRLNELAATLKKHKIYPKESLEELTSRLAVKISAELLSNLGKHVDNFNYKGALVVVHEIAGNLGITINM